MCGPATRRVTGGSLAHSGGRQLVKLGTRLIVGIQLDGTLLKMAERSAAHRYRLRPYLGYFGRLLGTLKCDVTLFTKAGPLEWEYAFRRFRHEFGCPGARFVQDDDLGSVVHQEVLCELAAEVASRPDRILHIGCRASHSVNINQLLVVEPLKLTKRLRGSERAKIDSKPEDKRVALTIDDYSLVAVAEMIKELAASDVAVCEYLKMEPLVESVRVPMYGTIHALPMENCDHIEQIDLSQLEVSEPIQWDAETGAVKHKTTASPQTAPKANDVPDDIPETKEHAEMFK